MGGIDTKGKDGTRRKNVLGQEEKYT